MVRVSVDVRGNDEMALEKALAVFKGKVRRAGILETYKAKQEYIKPSLKKREKRREALRNG